MSLAANKSGFVFEEVLDLLFAMFIYSGYFNYD